MAQADLCTDNAAMVAGLASAGGGRTVSVLSEDLNLDVMPNMPI